MVSYTRTRHFSGEVYSLQCTNKHSFTLCRFRCVEERWLLEESTSLPASLRQRPVAFDVISDVNKGSVGLFLVLQAVSNGMNGLQLYECDLKPLRLLHLTTLYCKELVGASTYTLFSGPQLAFISNGILCVFSSESKNVCKNSQTFHLNDILQIETLLSKTLFVALSDSGVCFILLQRKESFCSIPTRHFLPIEYVSLVTSIRVRVPHIVDHFMNALKQNTTCICTNNKNFVVFVHGVVRYTCPIPFGDVYSMWRHLNTFVLTGRQHGVCILKNTVGKIQVFQVWNEAKVALSGDFAGYGRQYLLLLRDREFSASSIIDLFGYEKEATITSHLSTVISALQKRLHIAQNAVACAEDESRQKQRLIDAIRLRVPNDPTLIASFPGRTCPVATSPIELPVQVTSFWNTIHRDVFVVGWTAKCKSEVLCLQTHLSVLDQSCNYVQTLSWNDCEATATIISKMPTFLNPEVKVTATISWRILGCWQWKSFELVLNVSEVLVRKFMFAKGLQDLQLMRVTQQTYLFHMSSRQEKMVVRILSSLPLQQLLIPNHPVVYMFTDNHLPLCGVNFQMNNSHLQVYFRDNAQLMLFIHWFYDAMPEGIFLLPKKDLVLPTKNSLKEELRLAEESVNIAPEKYENFRKSLLLQEQKNDRIFYNLLSL